MSTWINISVILTFHIKVSSSADLAKVAHESARSNGGDREKPSMDLLKPDMQPPRAIQSEDI